MSDHDPTEPIPGWPAPPVPGPGDAAGPPPTDPGGTTGYPPPTGPPPGGYGPPNQPPRPGYGPPPPAGPPPGYGPPPPGYGPPPPGYGYGYQGGYPLSRDHPEGTTILILGICSWVICGLCAPFAWIMGNKAIKEIDANPAAYSNRSTVQAGRILGMIYSILALVGLAFVFGLVLIGIFAGASSS